MTRAKPKRGEKKAAFEKAVDAGLKTIEWHCGTHGWTEFLVAGGRGVCKACNDARNEVTNARTKDRYHTDAEFRKLRRGQISEALAKRLGIPGQREEINAYFRERHAEKWETDPEYVGQIRECSAAAAWRTKAKNLAEGHTERKLPAWNGLEKEELQKLYEPLEHDDLWERDHLIPKNHESVTGLHCWANLTAVSMRWNRMKGKNFDLAAENNRWQRPANRFPGGAFDPYPTEHEWSVIAEQSSDLKVPVVLGSVELVADVIEGTDMETLLETLVADLDRKAREHEAHVAMLEEKGSWPALVMPEVPPVSIPEMIERRRIEVSAIAANDPQAQVAA